MLQPPENEIVKKLVIRELQPDPLPESKQLEGDVGSCTWLPQSGRSYLRSEVQRQRGNAQKPAAAPTHEAAGEEHDDESEVADESPSALELQRVPTLPPLPRFEQGPDALVSAPKTGRAALPLHRRVLKPNLHKYRHADALLDKIRERDEATERMIRQTEMRRKLSQRGTASVQSSAPTRPVKNLISNLPLFHQNYSFLGAYVQSSPKVQLPEASTLNSLLQPANILESN